MVMPSRCHLASSLPAVQAFELLPSKASGRVLFQGFANSFSKSFKSFRCFLSLKVMGQNPSAITPTSKVLPDFMGRDLPGEGKRVANTALTAEIPFKIT